MLMDADRRGIDHLRIALAGFETASEILSQTPSFRHRTNRL